MQVELRPIGSITPYENNPRVNGSGIEPVGVLAELDALYTDVIVFRFEQFSQRPAERANP